MAAQQRSSITSLASISFRVDLTEIESLGIPGGQIL